MNGIALLCCNVVWNEIQRNVSEFMCILIKFKGSPLYYMRNIEDGIVVLNICALLYVHSCCC